MCSIYLKKVVSLTSDQEEVYSPLRKSAHSAFIPLEIDTEIKAERLIYKANQLIDGILSIQDIQELNLIYARLDQLESSGTDNQLHGRMKICEKLSQKVQEMVRSTDLATLVLAGNSVSLYFISQINFLEFPKNLWSTYIARTTTDLNEETTLKVQVEIMEILTPRYKTDRQWQTAATALIDKLGMGRKKTISQHMPELWQAKINQKTVEFNVLDRIVEAMRREPETSYLRKLFKQGYFALLDYILSRNNLQTQDEKKAFEENTEFSISCQVITETVDALTMSVAAELQDKNPGHIILLLGTTGSGKSTTFCYLRGDRMIAGRGGTYQSEQNPTFISSDLVRSCTFLPNVAHVDDLCIIDFPGFSDTNGVIVSLGMELAIEKLLAKFQMKIMLIVPAKNDDRGVSIELLGERMKRLLVTSRSCLLGLTKYSDNGSYLRGEEGIVNSIESSLQNATETTTLVRFANLTLDTRGNHLFSQASPVEIREQLRRASVVQVKSDQDSRLDSVHKEFIKNALKRPDMKDMMIRLTTADLLFRPTPERLKEELDQILENQQRNDEVSKRLRQDAKEHMQQTIQSDGLSIFLTRKASPNMRVFLDRIANGAIKRVFQANDSDFVMDYRQRLTAQIVRLIEEFNALLEISGALYSTRATEISGQIDGIKSRILKDEKLASTRKIEWVEVVNLYKRMEFGLWFGGINGLSGMMYGGLAWALVEGAAATTFMALSGIGLVIAGIAGIMGIGYGIHYMYKRYIGKESDSQFDNYVKAARFLQNATDLYDIVLAIKAMQERRSLQ